MSEHPLEAAAIREALRRLGNPYARLQLPDEQRELLDTQAAAPVREKRVRVSEVVQGEAYTPGVSKRDFEAECRRIFRQYTPTPEQGRIRPDHRAFIARNRSMSPAVRHHLLEELRKYDLSGLPAFQAQFNREREALTAEKLGRIERAAVDKDA